MASNRLACRDCHSVVEPDKDSCPVCNSTSLTEDWAGYVIITHPERSEIGKKMGVDTPGRYALKVR